MFFNGWMAIARVPIVGLASYASLVILLRLSGKRTLSKMNAFDFVVQAVRSRGFLSLETVAA